MSFVNPCKKITRMRLIMILVVDADRKLTIRGGGVKLGLVYAAIPRLARYWRGLSEPKDTLIRFSLYLWTPEGRAIFDKGGHTHKDLRIANWRDWAKELHEAALVPKGQEYLLRGMEWPACLVISAIQGSPIFVGHHWFTGHPTIESDKLACLDWSAAREGPLVAYR